MLPLGINLPKQKFHINKKNNKLHVKTMRLANHDREPIFEKWVEKKATNLKKI